MFECSSTLFSTLEEKRGEKKTAASVIAIPLSPPVTLGYFNLSLRNISEVPSLYLFCFCTCLYFLSLEKTGCHSEGHLPENDREPPHFRQVHSNYLSAIIVH